MNYYSYNKLIKFNKKYLFFFSLLFLCIQIFAQDVIVPFNDEYSRSTYKNTPVNIDDLVDLESGNGNYSFEIAELKSGDLVKKLNLNLKLGSVQFYNSLKTSYGVNTSINIDGTLTKTINDVDDSIKIRLPEELNKVESWSGFFDRTYEHGIRSSSPLYMGQGFFNDNSDYFWGNYDLEDDVYSTNFDGDQNFFTYNKNEAKFLYHNTDIKVSKSPFLNITYKGINYKYGKNGRNYVTSYNGQGLGNTQYLPTEIASNNNTIIYLYSNGNETSFCGPERINLGFESLPEWNNYIFQAYGGDGSYASEVYQEIYDQCMAKFNNDSGWSMSCDHSTRTDPRFIKALRFDEEIRNGEFPKFECQNIENKIIDEVISEEVKVKFIYRDQLQNKLLQEIKIYKKNISGNWIENKKHEFSYNIHQDAYFLKDIKTFFIDNNSYNLSNSISFEYYPQTEVYNIENKDNINEKGIKISNDEDKMFSTLTSGAIKKIINNLNNNVIEIIYGSDYVKGANKSDIYGLRIEEIINYDKNKPSISKKIQFQYSDKNYYNPSFYRNEYLTALQIDANNRFVRTLNRRRLEKEYAESFLTKNPLYSKIKKINTNGSYSIYYYELPVYHFTNDLYLDSQLKKVENFTADHKKVIEKSYNYESFEYENIENNYTNIAKGIVNGFKSKFYIEASFNTFVTTYDYWSDDKVEGPFTYYNVYVVPYYNIKRPTLKEVITRDFIKNGAYIESKELPKYDRRNLLYKVEVVTPEKDLFVTNNSYNSNRNLVEEKKCKNDLLLSSSFYYYKDNLLYEQLTVNHDNTIISKEYYKYDGNNNLIEDYNEISNNRNSTIFGYNYTKPIVVFQNIGIEEVQNILNNNQISISSLQGLSNQDLKQKLLKIKVILGNHMTAGYTYDKYGVRDEIINENNNLNSEHIRNIRGQEIQLLKGNNIIKETQTNLPGLSHSNDKTINEGNYGKMRDFIIKSQSPQLFPNFMEEDCSQ